MTLQLYFFKKIIFNITSIFHLLLTLPGFPVSSAGKESTCNAGDPGLIPGLGRSPGEAKGCPLQHSWASLAAQLVKNPPAVWEAWVQSLGWEDPLEEGMATHLSFLAWRSPRILEWVAYPFSSGSSDPEIKSGPPALPFFTN